MFDPRRQRAPASESSRSIDDEWRGDEAVLAVARQIQEVTAVPLLSPGRYARLFSELAADIDEHGYDFVDSVKRVRNRCRDLGQPVSRADITFIIRGIVLRGHRFEEHANTPAVLGQQFCNNVRSMCLREQIQLDVVTEAAIRRWLHPESAS